MRGASAIARAAWTSILGSIGQGTATEIPNFHQETNGAPLGPFISPTPAEFDSIPFTAHTTGKLLVFGQITAGAQAAGQNCSFHLAQDGVFLPIVAEIVTSGASNVGMGAGGFPATASLLAFVSTTVGVSHTYGIQCLNLTVGQTVVVATGVANIAIYELP